MALLLSGSLVIQNSEESDEGKYECVAQNSKGVAHSRSAHLYVKGKECILGLSIQRLYKASFLFSPKSTATLLNSTSSQVPHHAWRTRQLDVRRRRSSNAESILAKRIRRELGRWTRSGADWKERPEPDQCDAIGKLHVRCILEVGSYRGVGIGGSEM